MGEDERILIWLEDHPLLAPNDLYGETLSAGLTKGNPRKYLDYLDDKYYIDWIN